MVLENQRLYTKKHLFFEAFGVLLLIFFVLFLYWYKWQKGNSKINMDDCDENCRLSYAIPSNEDPLLCKDIVDITIKNECYRMTGINTTDVTLCSQITEKFIEDWCVSSVAYFKRDKNMCDLLKDIGERKECVQKIEDAQNLDYTIEAKEKGNVELCQKIVLISTWPKDACIYDVAVKLKNPKICELLLERDKQGCVDDATHKGVDIDSFDIGDDELK